MRRSKIEPNNMSQHSTTQTIMEAHIIATQSTQQRNGRHSKHTRMPGCTLSNHMAESTTVAKVFSALFFHSTNVPSPSLLKHLLKGEGGAAE